MQAYELMSQLDAFDEESRKVINEQKHIFNTDMPILNFKMSPDKGMFNKGKTFHTIGQSDTTSIAQTMNNIKSQEAILTKMNESIAEQRNEYIEEKISRCESCCCWK